MALAHPVAAVVVLAVLVAVFAIIGNVHLTCLCATSSDACRSHNDCDDAGCDAAL